MVYDVFVIRAMVLHVFMLFSEGKGQSVSCDNKHVIVSM